MSRILYYCKILFCTLIVSSTVTLAFLGLLFITSLKIPKEYFEAMIYIAFSFFIISTGTCFMIAFSKIHEIQRMKVDFNVYRQIANKERSFILCNDMYDIKPNDTLILVQAINQCQTGEFLTKKVKFVLKGCLDDGLKNGYCIVQF